MWQVVMACCLFDAAMTWWCMPSGAYQRFPNKMFLVQYIEYVTCVNKVTFHIHLFDDTKLTLLDLTITYLRGNLMMFYYWECFIWIINHGWRGQCQNTHMRIDMMTSLNRNIFRVTGHLCGEFTGHWWRPVTRSFGVFFDLHLNERLSKQSWGWWFETISRPLWHHSNGTAISTWIIFCRHFWGMRQNALITRFGC